MSEYGFGDYGESGGTATALILPTIEDDAIFGPVIGGSSVAGLQLFGGSTLLEEAHARSFMDELAGDGQFTFTLANTDPALADVPFGGVVRWQIDGQYVFAGVVQRRRKRSIAIGGAKEQVTVVRGPSTKQLLERAIVQPSRGPGALPVETTRVFAWHSIEYDASSVPNAKALRHTDYVTIKGRKPEQWLDGSSMWIWADLPEVTIDDAPGGRCLFLSPNTGDQALTLAETTLVRIFAALDNFGTVYVDSIPVIDTENDISSFVTGKYVDIELSAGTHRIGVSCLNTGGAGGINLTYWSVDGDGLADTLIGHTDNTWQCFSYPYPNNVPGFTVGEVAEILLAEGAAALPDFTLGCTGALDTAGEPWSITAEIAFEVGRSYLEAFGSLEDYLADVQVAPGANELRLWRWSTRNEDIEATPAVTSDRMTTEIAELDHDGVDVRLNDALVRYKHNWTTEEDADSIAEHGVFQGMIDLGLVGETQAQRIAATMMALRKDPSNSNTIDLRPVTTFPYQTFDNGAALNHPDADGDTNPHRVQSISLSVDDKDNTKHEWTIETHDVRQVGIKRLENWLKRVGMGNLGGGGRATTRTGDPIMPAQRIASDAAVDLSMDGPLQQTPSLNRAASTSGNVFELFGTLTVPGDTTTSVRVALNGSLLEVLTFPAGELEAVTRTAVTKTYRDVDKYSAELLSVGLNAEGLDVQVRALPAAG